MHDRRFERQPMGFVAAQRHLECADRTQASVRILLSMGAYLYQQQKLSGLAVQR